MQEQERWLSVEEIAVHLGVNHDTIYKWIDRRQMLAHKLGKLWKFKASEINEWIRAGKAAEDAEKNDRRTHIHKRGRCRPDPAHTVGSTEDCLRSSRRSEARRGRPCRTPGRLKVSEVDEWVQKHPITKDDEE